MLLKTNNPPEYDAFLSHNSADQSAVEQLARYLQDQGLRPFLDKWHLVPGEPWQEALEDALEASQTVVVFLGPGQISPWENEEMRSALEDRARDKSRRVIPVLLPGAHAPEERRVPRFLRRLTWVDLRDGLDDSRSLYHLVCGIKGIPPGSEPQIQVNHSIKVDTWVHPTQAGVAGVAVSADGERILAGTLGKDVICLDRRGELLWSAMVGNQAWRVGLSADAQRAIVGTGSTRPWDLGGRGLYAFDGEGHLLWNRRLKSSVWGLDLSADGQTITVGTDGNEALLYDGEGSRLWRQRMIGSRWIDKAIAAVPMWWAWVMTVAISANGQTVAVGAMNKLVQVLDRGGNLLGQHRCNADVYAVSVSADGETVAAGSNGQRVYLLNRWGNLLWHHDLEDKIWSVALSADGQVLAVGAGEKEAHVRTFGRSGQPVWKRYVEGSVSCVALSGQGNRVMAGTRAGHLYLFDQDGEALYHSQTNKMVRDVALSADGGVAVAGSEGGSVSGVLLDSA